MATGCTVLQYPMVAPSVVGAYNTVGGYNVQHFIPQLGLVLQCIGVHTVTRSSDIYELASSEISQNHFHNTCSLFAGLFLASQEALEVMNVSESVSESVSEGTNKDFTDVTLVSDDTNCFT